MIIKDDLRTRLHKLLKFSGTKGNGKMINHMETGNIFSGKNKMKDRIPSTKVNSKTGKKQAKENIKEQTSQVK